MVFLQEKNTLKVNQLKVVILNFFSETLTFPTSNSESIWLVDVDAKWCCITTLTIVEKHLENWKYDGSYINLGKELYYY